MLINLDPTTISDTPIPPPPPYSKFPSYRLKDKVPCPIPEPPSLSGAPPFPTPKPGEAAPPPIDPGVFRSVTTIRELIDEAAELAVRASCGLSSAALGMKNNGLSSLSGSTWAAAQSLGINPLGDFGGRNGRNVTMSATRVHKLRVLAVEKLAAAYKTDEIASSVMVMQGGSVFDDIAERVLKIGELSSISIAPLLLTLLKIRLTRMHVMYTSSMKKYPQGIIISALVIVTLSIVNTSAHRQLAESTTTTVLDSLIAAYPQRLEYYRTRGIVHCFRDEYSQAVKDFTHALKESRALRKARSVHSSFRAPVETRPKGKKKKAKVNGQAPPSGTSAVVEKSVSDQLVLHPSTLPDAPDPIEPQLLFHRGAAYLAHAIHVIEEAIYTLEGVRKGPQNDITETRLCYIENGKYGGTEINNPDGPLGRSDGAKAKAYKELLADPKFKEMVDNLLKKSKRDHERFLAHFDTLGGPETESFDFAYSSVEDCVEKMKNAFSMLGMLRTQSRPHNDNASVNGNNPSKWTSSSSPTSSQSYNEPLPLTTYHPLLVESYFSILIAQLLLGEFTSLLPTFARTAHLVVGLEGYPVFLPPRSMAQAEWIETLERLAGGWNLGKLPEYGVESSLVQIARDDYQEPGFVDSPSGSEPPSSPTSTSGDSSSYTCARSSAFPPSSTAGSSGLSQLSASSSSTAVVLGCASSISGSGMDAIAISKTYSSSAGRLSALTGLRVLLAPVMSKQKEAASATSGALVPVTSSRGKNVSPITSLKEKEREDANANTDTGTILNFNARGKASINIPLHGPRVEIMLAWLAAVHLPELEDAYTA